MTDKRKAHSDKAETQPRQSAALRHTSIARPKRRARVGLAVLAFACIYTIICGRLVYLASTSDAQGERRGGGDIIATARPDIQDRNGEVLATDVRMPSLFGEPRRIIDVDEAVELLTATVPDLNANELRERLSSKRGFVWLKREITKEAAAADPPAWHSRYWLSCREQACLSERSCGVAPSSAM